MKSFHRAGISTIRLAAPLLLAGPCAVCCCWLSAWLSACASQPCTHARSCASTRDQSATMRAVLPLAVLMLSLRAPLAATTAASPPNHIVSILADDLGYHDRSSAGNPDVSTPHLDYLFKTGVSLQRYYAYKYCSPTRRAFVTGRWPLHLGELNQKADGIDLRMTTLAQKLSQAGYYNVLVGKTHWGVATTHHLPAYRGWHEHTGYLGGGEAYWSGHECLNESTNCQLFSQEVDFWKDRAPAPESLLGQYSTTLFTQLALAALRNASGGRPAGRPLWLHLNYQAVHNPQTTPPGQPNCGNLSASFKLVFRQVLEKMDVGARGLPPPPPLLPHVCPVRCVGRDFLVHRWCLSVTPQLKGLGACTGIGGRRRPGQRDRCAAAARRRDHRGGLAHMGGQPRDLRQRQRGVCFHPGWCGPG
jgi:hypothetical protein